MAEIPINLKEKLKNFIDEVEKLDIHIQEAFLFGSYAKGNNNDWSDIDIALVSKDFQGIRIFDNQKLIHAILKIDTSIETMPYRPEDFTPDNLFVKEILKTGIRII